MCSSDLVVMLCRLILSILWMVLEIILSEFPSHDIRDLIVIVDSIREENNFVELKIESYEK